jgi:hypothetical protein
MRLGCAVLAAALAACGGGGQHPLAQKCSGESSDPNACLAVAKDKLSRKDEVAAREFVEKFVLAVSTAPACARDYQAEGCFAGIVALLRDRPVGLLAEYAVSDDILGLVPRWTGSDATGPRAQARIALSGMCNVPGRDPIAQQRACLVLADLVEDERMKRCGPGCDVTDQQRIPGWSTKDVVDGYDKACKVDRSKVPAVDYTPFANLVSKTYSVSGTNPVCEVAKSTQKGASIPDALANAERIRSDIRAREHGMQSAAKREAERMAAMEKMKVEAAAKAAAAEEAEFKKNITDAIKRSDWATTFGLLTKRRPSPIDASVSDALNRIWEPFSGWVVKQNGAAAAYLDLSSRLAQTPKNHVIRVSLATLQETALEEARAQAKLARGVGGTWLRAAIVSRIAGPSATKEKAAANAAWTKLLATARTSLALEALAPACSPVIRPPVTGGRTVKAKSTLQCTLEPEKSFVTKEPFKVKQHVVGPDGIGQDIEQETMVEVHHRTYKVVVHGVIAIYQGAPRRAVPIDFEEVVDDTDGSDTRKFDKALATVRDLITRETVGTIEAEDAAKALAAGQAALQNGRKEAAENQLVIHGVIAGSSPELDEIMTTHGISFAELMQPQ